MKSTVGLWPIAVLVAALVSVACGVAEKRRGANAALDGGLVASDDGATSNPLILTPEHPGWKKQLCLSCHGQSAAYPHEDAGYAPPGCVNCHGYNGAPHRAHATLENVGCKSCHGDVAHTAAFKAPDDCVVCHNHPALQ